MGLDDVKRFMSDASKEHLIDTLIRQGVVTSDDAVTLREAENYECRSKCARSYRLDGH